ncbi:MAG: pilus assembly protein, partial [Ruaniaceae bacterium]|nr:pilus assembly protein [Ruaniaceae bacterium]
NVLIDSAAEGARYGALAGNDSSQAVARTRSLIAMSIDARYAADVVAARGEADGVPILSVTVRAPLPLVWLYGPSSVLTVSGRAVDEERL